MCQIEGYKKGLCIVGSFSGGIVKGRPVIAGTKQRYRNGGKQYALVGEYLLLYAHIFVYSLLLKRLQFLSGQAHQAKKRNKLQKSLSQVSFSNWCKISICG